MKIVVALGGNALLKRGDPLTEKNQRDNVRKAAKVLAPVAKNNQLIITHGNGPQVGLLALESASYAKEVGQYSLDVLGAETEGMIGYMIEQELRNEYLKGKFATLLTQIEVDPNDPGFKHPSKPVGPVYEEAEAKKLAKENSWTIVPDGKKFRRAVPSPLPKKIIGLHNIDLLIEDGITVICAGGGGIPVIRQKDGKLSGVVAVIDKDRASSLLARDVDADMFIMVTDVDGVFPDWGKEGAKPIRHTPPKEIEKFKFAAGSMKPKVEAACHFAEATGKKAVIGALSDLEKVLQGEAGTTISLEYQRLEMAP